MINARKQLEYLIGDVVKYGNLFIESDAGRNWEKLGTGSVSSNSLPKWAVFYTDLFGSKFNDVVESLIAVPVSVYQKGKILDEIKSLFNKIKEVNPLNDTNYIRNGKTFISTQPEVIIKFRKEFEHLFDIEVVDNYPWNGHERNDVIIIKDINDDYQDILLDKYYAIIDHYENLEANRIKKLEGQLRDQEDNVINLKRELHSNQELFDKIEKLTGKIDELNVAKIKVESDNDLLSKQIIELKNVLVKNQLEQKANEEFKIQLLSDIEGLKKENDKLRNENDSVYLLDDDLSDEIHNDMFALILMNELDLLDLKIWNSPERVFGNVVFNMLKISKKKKLEASSIIRHRHTLLHPDKDPVNYERWQIKYGERITKIIKYNFPNREVKLTKPI